MSEKRLKERVGATIQMYVGDDDDLIRWVSSLEKGEGNRAIKRMLRKGLGLPEPERAESEVDQKLFWLHDQVLSLQEQLSAPALRDTGSGENVSGQIQQVQRQLTLFASDMRRIERMVEQIQTSGSHPDAAPSAETLSHQALQKRQNRLGKNSW